jgi:alanyl-tRNA synthetase
LARGLKLLDEASAGLKKGDRLKGDVAFKLYDTYGFPLDLTEESLRARGVTVDTDGFSAAMQKQKAEARASWSGSGEAASEAQWFAVLDEVGRTEFLGYDTEEAEGVVLAIFKDGGRVMAANAGEAVEIVTNQTPFYGESGGQAGDSGHMASAKAKGQVTDTQKRLGALHIHAVRITFCMPRSSACWATMSARKAHW